MLGSGKKQEATVGVVALATAGTDASPVAADLASPTVGELAAIAAGGSTGRRDGSAGKEMAGTAATRPRERGCGSAPKRRVRSGGQHQRVWSSAGGRMSGMARPVCSQRWQRRAADAVRCGGGVTGSWLWRRGCGCCGYGGCGDGGCGDRGRGCGGRRYGGLGRLAGAYVTP